MLKLNLLTAVLLFTILSLNSFPQEDYFGNIIKSDGFGNSYAAGSFKSKTITFGNFNLQNLGAGDLFLVKYDSNGKAVWAESIGGTGNEEVISVEVDINGNISLLASSNSKEIYLDNSVIKNHSNEIIFNAEFNSTGRLTSSKVVKEIQQTGNISFKHSTTDTSITIISPSENDNWKVGTKATLKWEIENVEFILIELSTDNGVTWQYISATISGFDEYPVLVPNSPSDSCLIRISDYYNPAVADTSGLFKISGELYWAIKQGVYNSVLTSAFILDSNTCIVAGYNGISKTTNNGATWVNALDGIGLFDVYFLNDSVGWAVGLNGNIFKTTNKGNDWIRQDSSFNFHLLKVYFYNENNGYMISDRYFIKTEDGGATWTLTQPTSHVLRAMYFLNKDTGWIAGGEGVILKTTNAGSSWSYQQLNGTAYGTLTSLYFTAANTGYTSGSGLDIQGGVVLKTSNSGNQWSLAHNGFNRFIYSISFSTPDSGWIVGDEGIMFSTTNGGMNWELQGSGTLSDLHSITMKSNQVGWSVGNDGVILKFVHPTSNPVPVELISLNAWFKNNKVNLNWTTVTETNNSGFEIERKISAEWESIGFVKGNGTTTKPVNYFFRDDWENRVYNGDVSYRLKQIDYDGSYKFFEVVVNINTLPIEYSLSQNYPNPFNPSTTIKYSLKENVMVTLKIYDILGREMVTLVDGVMPSGNHSINFDAANFSSGTYFYTIQATAVSGQAGNFIQTKKMLLVK